MQRSMWTRFAAIGDSFVEGLEDELSAERHLGWADRVAQGLSRADADACYANFAIRGRRLPQIVSQQLPAALALKPDLVCLEGGVNDAMRPAAWDADAVRLMLENGIIRIKESGADVLMFAYGDMGIRSKMIGLISNRVDQLTLMTRELSAQYGCYLADLSVAPVFNDPRVWAPDRLHLNPVGHDRVARAVLDCLGVEPDLTWAEDLPEEYRPKRSALLRSDAVFVRDHFGPWLGRRVTRRSAGDGIAPKRPEMLPVESPMSPMSPAPLYAAAA